MSLFTLADLQAILRQAAGEIEGYDFGGDVAGRTFADLGYDSLALLEVAARIEQEHGVPVPDEMLSGSTTPYEAVELVNRLLSTVVVAA